MSDWADVWAEITMHEVMEHVLPLAKAGKKQEAHDKCEEIVREKIAEAIDHYRRRGP